MRVPLLLNRGRMTYATRTAVALTVALAVTVLLPVRAGTVQNREAARSNVTDIEVSGFPPPSCVPGEELFIDVPAASGFCRWIEELARIGVVTGCGGGAYCPGNPVTRAQMPVFLLKTLEGSGYTPPSCVPGAEVFNDVPAANGFCRWIEDLARRGVTSGCSAVAYCPTSPVTRAQMPVFLLKTLEGSGYAPPPCVSGREVFTDVPAASPFCPWIEELARRGVTGGCSPDAYCPGNQVNRAQMAVFVLKTLGRPGSLPASAPESAPQSAPESAPPSAPESTPAPTPTSPPTSPPESAPESTPTSPPASAPESVPFPDTAPE
jgi:hypothetical protein